MSHNVKIYENDELLVIDRDLVEFDTDIYHSRLWLQANQELQEGSLFAIMVENGSNRAFLPLLKRDINHESYYDLITPYGYGGIAFSKDATASFKNTVLDKVYEYLSDDKCISMFLRLHPLLNGDIDSSCIFQNGVTLAVKLDRDYETIKKSYASGHRYDIKKALKTESISVIDDIDFEYFREFIDIYIETMEKLNASDFYHFNEDYFYYLKDSLGDSLKLIVVKLDDAVIGASLFMMHNNIIQYHLSGTTEEGRSYQPSKLIIDYMIKFGVSEDYEYLHLGGGVGSEKDKLYEFKKRFSASEFNFTTVKMITNKEVYTDLCTNLNYSDSEIKDLSGFFPLYRK